MLRQLVPSYSAVVSLDGSALSTRSAAVGPQSSEAHSSVTHTLKNRGSGNSGIRIFCASNVDSHTTQNVCSTSVISESIISPQSVAENISTLKYVNVSIDGVDNNLDALNDSGSQINLIHGSIIPDNKMQTVGRIAISGAFGAPVQTDVALLSIKPAVSDTNVVNIAPPLEAWSKPEGLEVRLPIRPAMKSEATNQKNRYSLKRVPNYF